MFLSEEKKNGKWVPEMSGMSGGLRFDQPASGQTTALLADNPRKLPNFLIFFSALIFSRALWFEHLEQAFKLPDPLFFGKNEMNWMCNYLGHCLFLFCLFLSPYRYHRTLSLSLPSSPPSATPLLLPPCHHHNNYRYIVTKQPMIIFPQTDNQIKKSSTLVILS